METKMNIDLPPMLATLDHANWLISIDCSEDAFDLVSVMVKKNRWFMGTKAFTDWAVSVSHLI